MTIISVSVITPEGLDDWASAPSEGWRLVAVSLSPLFDMVHNLTTRAKLRDLMNLGAHPGDCPRLVIVQAVELMELYRLVCISMSDVVLNSADDAKTCAYDKQGQQRSNPLDLTTMPASVEMESHLQLLYMLHGLLANKVDATFRVIHKPLLHVV